MSEHVASLSMGGGGFSGGQPRFTKTSARINALNYGVSGWTTLFVGIASNCECSVAVDQTPVSEPAWRVVVASPLSIQRTRRTRSSESMDGPCESVNDILRAVDYWFTRSVPCR